MTVQEINKKFAELAGRYWHEHIRTCVTCSSNPDHYVNVCSCGEQRYAGFTSLDSIEYHIKRNNPDFCGDPRLVLEVMMKRENWDEFQATFCIGIYSGEKRFWGVHLDYILDTTGKLALKAIEWMEEAKR